MYESARKYGLYQPDAAVFEALCLLCKKTGECKTTYEKLGFLACCKTMTVSRSLERLKKAGLISQNEKKNYQIEKNNSQNEKEKGTEKENINKEKSGVVIDHTTHTTFFDFFNIFSPHGEYKTYEKACKKIWDTMPEDWRALAKARVASVSTTKNPLFYLQDEDFLKVGTADPSQKEKAAPTWLTGEQQTDCLRAGIILAVCKNPETGKFGTVTKEDADKFGLDILRTM